MFPSPLEVWVVSYQREECEDWYVRRFPSPLEVWVVSYKANRYSNVLIEKFPSPLEVWVVSYTIEQSPNERKVEEVSVPSRGMGGFLQQVKVFITDKITVFPSPLEVWVVSYFIETGLERFKGGFRPLSRYGWFPTGGIFGSASQVAKVSVPSRGMGGFLPHILYPKRETIHKIVPTWKLT